MSVNDLLCVGAQPLFFLDYFATGKLNSGIAEQVIAGIVEGCSHAQCALVGGETAEMPDFYAPGEYDLGGFAVGLVDRAKVLPQGQPGSSKAGKAPSPGDVLIGVGSSGFHSNGYSLIRKWIPKGPEGDSLAREFLTPTRIYVKSAMPLIRERKVKALAHITGSGFLNVPRMSSKVSYRIELPELSQVAPIFSKVLPQSGLPLQELAQTFNLGVGLVAIVAAKDAERVVARLCKAGEKAWILGEVIKRPRGKNCEVHVSSPSLGEPAVLVYE
jgi:phosphoribosylformylglycinamidine cyclo-ligase